MSSLIVPSRRGFLSGLGAVICAPAIVRASNLMSVKVMDSGPWWNEAGVDFPVGFPMDPIGRVLRPGIQQFVTTYKSLRLPDEWLYFP